MVDTTTEGTVEGTGGGRRGERWLSARGVSALSNTPGRHADGGGLYLVVDAGRRSWLWRYRIGDKRRDMGLGAVVAVSLAEARAERDRWRSVLKTGRDPIEERSRQLEHARVETIPTFGEIADSYIEAKEPGWKNAKHAAQWRMTLTEYARPLRTVPVDRIATADILAVLKPIWHDKHVTAARLRGRIEMVLDAARALGHIEEGRANPARWRGHLDKLLTERAAHTRRNYAAMPFTDVPAFIMTLRAADTIGARALEFTILTAVRTGEAMGARWGEFNLDAKVWTIPKERMKAGREHRVPLTERALAIITEVGAVSKGAFVFPGRMPKRPLTKMAFATYLKRDGLDATAHGFRSSFRDWAGEETQFPREIAEAALAHVVGDHTERAYRRGDALERRRALMEAWAAFLEPGAGGNIVKFTTSAAGRA